MPQRSEPSELLHPDIRAVIGAMAVPTMDAQHMAQMRTSPLPRPALSEAVERTDHVVPGDPGVAIRVHRPQGVGDALPCLYTMHGGGYVVGSYAMDDARFDVMCPRLQIAGVSLDYRLAPDTPYPGSLEDCYRGLVWVHQHAEEIGIDPAHIGVGGTSAGGGLAAALALLARDRGEVPVAFQLLDCPMIDDRQITHSSRLDGLPVWSRESNTYGWRSYLGDQYGAPDLPYTAAAARCHDLSGLPPTFVSVGAVDGFLDEDVDYAMRLNHAGVPTELHVYPGACHGYQYASDSEIALQSRRDIADWLARQIRDHPATLAS
jgi:acetyl esterase/lipase